MTEAASASYGAPKMGTDNDVADNLISVLRQLCRRRWKENCPAEYGEVRVRQCTICGTRVTSEQPLTADVRRTFGTLLAKLFTGSGPLRYKVIYETEYKRAINGEPLTLEFASCIFRNEGVYLKVAMLIKYY